jgi:hypothetical protein
MSSDNKNRSDDANFSFAVRELRQARTAAHTLAVDPGPKKTAFNNQGSDPYNTSGGFDRTKNWTRVGKR